MQAPAQPRLLSQLLDAERSLQRRSNLVASRFELASSVMIVLQLVCHSAAAVDDLGLLADERNLAERGLGATLQAWWSALMVWLGDLVPRSPRAVYASIAEAALRETEIAIALRQAARHDGDASLAQWCGLWIEQRTRLASRLIASLAAEDVTPVEAAPMFARPSLY